ncbi:uncharacterized protein [Primulina eburnea]|uniref:uncharacterized protein n=1 Tax=Primulina eburnea TaxID=1245227 RepID=UPI003C6C98FE
MNNADVSKQIQQMVRFIRQEAEEKANEISISAEEEFNIEKLQLVEAEKKKIRQEYERKERQIQVRRKIYARAYLVEQLPDDAKHVFLNPYICEFFEILQNILYFDGFFLDCIMLFSYQTSFCSSSACLSSVKSQATRERAENVAQVVLWKYLAALNVGVNAEFHSSAIVVYVCLR